MPEYKSKEQKRKFYNSKAWESVRQQALKRDNYECQDCKRLGLVKMNDEDKHKTLDVDHVKEIYTHPELALEIDNLRTLCIVHHNEKHKRYFRRKPNRWEEDERW